MAQITNIVSEALQARIRAILPSQAGFTEDLQAQNVIVPIVDLTPTAEGSSLRANLQEAVTFTQANVFNLNNSFTTVADTPGFWRIVAGFAMRASSSTGVNTEGKIEISDGSTNKAIYKLLLDNGTASISETYIDTIFLQAGELLKVNAVDTRTNIAGYCRQVADLQGNLVNPTGFTPQ